MPAALSRRPETASGEAAASPSIDRNTIDAIAARVDVAGGDGVLAAAIVEVAVATARIVTELVTGARHAHTVAQVAGHGVLLDLDRISYPVPRARDDDSVPGVAAVAIADLVLPHHHRPARAATRDLDALSAVGEHRVLLDEVPAALGMDAGPAVAAVALTNHVARQPVA